MTVNALCRCYRSHDIGHISDPMWSVIILIQVLILYLPGCFEKSV